MNPTEYAIQAFQRGDWVVLRAPGSGKNRWKFWAVRREGVSTTRVWGTRIGPDQGHAQTNAGSDEVLSRDIRRKIDERQHQVRAVLKGAQSLPLSFSPDDLPGMLDPAAHPERSIRGEELSGHQLASALTFSPRVWEPTPAKGATRSIRGDALLARRGWRASPPGRDLRTSSRYDVNTDYVRQVIQNGQWVALQRTRDGPGGPSHAYWAIRLAASDDGSGGEWHYREGATIGPTRVRPARARRRSRTDLRTSSSVCEPAIGSALFARADRSGPPVFNHSRTPSPHWMHRHTQVSSQVPTSTRRARITTGVQVIAPKTSGGGLNQSAQHLC